MSGAALRFPRATADTLGIVGDIVEDDSRCAPSVGSGGRGLSLAFGEIGIADDCEDLVGTGRSAVAMAVEDGGDDGGSGEKEDSARPEN